MSGVEAGQRAERTFRVDDARIEAFADVSGDRNPVHLDDAYAAGTRFGGRVAHGMLTAAFFSGLLLLAGAYLSAGPEHA